MPETPDLWGVEGVRRGHPRAPDGTRVPLAIGLEALEGDADEADACGATASAGGRALARAPSLRRGPHGRRG